MWRDYYRVLLEDEKAFVIVAVVDRLTIGFLVSTIVSRPPIYEVDQEIVIDSIVVHPDYRQKGVFAGMLSLLMENARDAGTAAVRLSVHHKNEEALRAYEKENFVLETISMIRWVE